MPSLEKIQSVAAKLAPEGAETASESDAAAPPAGPGSGAASAPAGESGEEQASFSEDPAPRAATIDADAIEKKLAVDRERRREREERKRLAEEREAAKRDREEAEAAKKAAAAELEKVKGMSWLERAKADGRDPRQVFEEMKDEALRAGTPEAIVEKISAIYDAKIAALESKLSETDKRYEEREKKLQEERERVQRHAEEREFQADFHRGIAMAEFESLRDEYEDDQIFRIVQAQRTNPGVLFEHAKALGVRMEWEEEAAALLAAGEELTDVHPTYTMLDILRVMKATQDRHHARLEEQRRKKQAATQTAPGAPEKKAPAKSQPTVNGTAERKAGMGNELAATTAAKAPSLKGLSREEKLKRLGEKYG